MSKKEENYKKTIMTNKTITITIVVLIILTVLAFVIINRTKITEITERINNEGKIKNEQQQLFSYEVYDTQDENSIKILITVSNSNGIESLETQEQTILGYGKPTLTLDYSAKKDSVNTFKVKGSGTSEEKTDTITINDDFIHDNGLALDETDQSGYKEMTITSKLGSLKDRFTSYSYKIGENGTWIDRDNVTNGKYKISVMDYDLMQNDLVNSDNTVTIYTKVKDINNNTVIVSKDYNVNISENVTSIESESLIKAVESYNGGNGKYAVTANDEAYNLKVYQIDGNLEIGSDVLAEIGNEKDVATSDTDMAKNMIVLKVNGNLTVDENSALTAYENKDGFGGPKGMFIYCTGTITNKGDISMSGKGAHAEGQNVYLTKNTDGSYEYVPADGEEGGEGYNSSSSILLGNKGKDGNGRQTGGAGAGNGGVGTYTYAGVGWSGTHYAAGGKGSKGTSYSGGLSGTNGRVDVWYVAGNGWYHREYPGTNGPANGGHGAGGLLILYGNNINNEENGIIEANGINIKTTKENNGGGSINIFSKTSYSNQGTIEANGSGSGGKGTVTTTQID